MSERIQTSETKKPSQSQQRLIDLVKNLAKTQGGDTKDVLFSGAIELWPGRTLKAHIIDDDANDVSIETVDNEPVHPIIYDLEVIDEASEEPIESISVDTGTCETTQVFEDAEPYLESPGGAPDLAIASFFDRYWLQNVDQVA
jgi:hypothetical protein